MNERQLFSEMSVSVTIAALGRALQMRRMDDQDSGEMGWMLGERSVWVDAESSGPLVPGKS